MQKRKNSNAQSSAGQSMKQLRLTKNAVKNHEELFPNHESKLQKTDPEFIELFDNWAFDEVIRQSRMDTKTRVRLILASTIASQALGEYKVMVGAALNVGLTPIEIKEILYQAIPYVGVAKVFDFLRATNEELQNNGVSLPLEGQSTTTPETRFEKGVAAQKAIFGEAIDKMRQQAPKDQMHIQDFLAANCFGDYYTRNGLDIKTRELLTFAMLISLGGCEPQVKGHVTGNLNVGNGRTRLIDVVTQLLPYIGYPRTLNALRVIDEVVPPTNITSAGSTAH
jgi:4-carboxymuconolactone decarboxylase